MGEWGPSVPSDDEGEDAVGNEVVDGADDQSETP